MIQIDDVISRVANNTGYDKELVGKICKHVFNYTVSAMKDDTNTKDILFNELFKFKLKRRFKENKTNIYSSK